ncbi:hypothetical protein [Streptomyces sp. Qhu-G9]|uniref:hypothetical protein n=1 Tax=Streptomyces sp. Qhu-G9 TaxID=3452799 RepID=UPI002F2B2BF0
MELKGALRYYGTDARRLGEVLRVRTLSRLGTDVRVGIGPTITVAATASGQITAPGGVLAVDPDQVADWLGPLPVEALHGIGPKQAAALREYGVHCVGLLAAIPPATVQRLLGGKAGRVAADRAAQSGERCACCPGLIRARVRGSRSARGGSIEHQASQIKPSPTHSVPLAFRVQLQEALTPSPTQPGRRAGRSQRRPR